MEAPNSLLSLDVARIAPVGHYLAIRVGFAFPVEEVNQLPRAWVEHYTTQCFMLSDPVIRWVHTNEGVTRWSAIAAPDPDGVLDAARTHGMNFGAAASTRESGPSQTRSFGLFLRSDREFLDQELDLLQAYLAARHQVLSSPCNLTAAEVEALRLVKEGLRIKQISYQLGASEGAVKQRLRSARIKLAAKTGAEAISRAAAIGLI